MQRFAGITRAAALVIDGILHGFYASSASINEQELNDSVRKQLPYYSVPERWLRVDDIPLNSNGNIGVACWLLYEGIESREYPLSSVANATASNLCAAILIRSEPIINLLFFVFSSVPTWVPLGIRRICANVFHIGGIHVGCAIAAVIWFVIFVVGATLDLRHLAGARPAQLAEAIMVAPDADLERYLGGSASFWWVDGAHSLLGARRTIYQRFSPWTHAIDLRSIFTKSLDLADCRRDLCDHFPMAVPPSRTGSF